MTIFVFKAFGFVLLLYLTRFRFSVWFVNCHHLGVITIFWIIIQKKPSGPRNVWDCDCSMNIFNEHLWTFTIYHPRNLKLVSILIKPFVTSFIEDLVFSIINLPNTWISIDLTTSFYPLYYYPFLNGCTGVVHIYGSGTANVYHNAKPHPNGPPQEKIQSK